MKASELRIGNYVSGDINKLIVVNIDNLNVHIILKEKWLQPITLTEEWLVKFGFEKGTLIYKNDSFNFNGEIVFKGEDSFRYFGTNAKLKHVHQLQNLYWCLCGEELKIDL